MYGCGVDTQFTSNRFVRIIELTFYLLFSQRYCGELLVWSKRAHLTIKLR